MSLEPRFCIRCGDRLKQIKIDKHYDSESGEELWKILWVCTKERWWNFHSRYKTDEEITSPTITRYMQLINVTTPITDDPNHEATHLQIGDGDSVETMKIVGWIRDEPVVERNGTQYLVTAKNN